MLSLARCTRASRVTSFGAFRRNVSSHEEIELGPRQKSLPPGGSKTSKLRPYIPSAQVLDIDVRGEGQAMKAVRTSVGSTHGRVFVEIRNWRVFDGDDELTPAPQGISLTVAQFKKLKEMMPKIDRLIEKADKQVVAEGWHDKPLAK